MFYARSCIYLSFQRTYTDVYRTNNDHTTEQLVLECDWWTSFCRHCHA